MLESLIFKGHVQWEMVLIFKGLVDNVRLILDFFCYVSPL